MNNLEIAEILRKARAVISDPSHWTKGLFARNSQGQWCNVDSYEAVCFCSVGAVQRVVPNQPVIQNYAYEALTKAAGCAIINYNDQGRRKHHEILAVFDKSITQLENCQ